MLKPTCCGLLVALAASGCSPASSVPRWSMLERDGRSTRGAMARLGDRLIAFGGERQGIPTDETWAWDGERWELLHPVHRPPARSGHGMATVGDQLVLFGGDAVQRRLNDTWLFDGTDWSQPPVVAHPVDLFGFAFASLGQRAVLFGSTPAGAETWEWDGTGWSRRTPVNQPAPRLWPAMAEVQGRLVLFGGAVPLLGQTLGDTWSWDGTDWTALSPMTSPSPRSGAACATVNGHLLVFGGSDYRTLFQELWSFDGSAWSRVAAFNPPPPMSFAAGASLGGRLVVAGGQMENLQPARRTWVLSGTSWSSRGAELRPAQLLGVIDGGLFASGPPSLGSEPRTMVWVGGVWAPLVTQPPLTGSLFTVGGRLVSPTLRPDGGTEDWVFDGQRWTVLRGIDPRPPGQVFTLFTRGERLFSLSSEVEWAWDEGTWRKARDLSSASTDSVVFEALSRATLEPLINVYGPQDGGTLGTAAWSLEDGAWRRADFRFPERATAFAVGDEPFSWGQCDGHDGGARSPQRLCRWADAGWREVETEGVPPPPIFGAFVPAGPDVYFVGQGTGDLWLLRFGAP